MSLLSSMALGVDCIEDCDLVRVARYTRLRDYHPLLTVRADTGEVLHIRLRKGRPTPRADAALRRRAHRPCSARRRSGRSGCAPTRGSGPTTPSQRLEGLGTAVLDRRAPATACPRGYRGIA